MNEASQKLIRSVRQGFEQNFHSHPRALACAPGRINIIGGHTDYNLGLVLPCAVEMYVAAAVSARDDGKVVAISGDYPPEGRFHLSDAFLTGKWHDAVKGVLESLQKSGADLPGLSLFVEGNLPAEAGLSSSAAFMVSLVMAIYRIGGIDLTAEEVALTAQKVEVDFFGVKCGILDQMASAACRKGHALFLDCRDLSTRDIPIPPDISFLVGDTGVRRKLAGDSPFNRRVEQCAQAVKFLADRKEPVESLRDADLPMLARHEKTMPDVLLKRARHIVTENARVIEATKALYAEDIRKLGALVTQAHVSLRDDYEVSWPELNAMVDAMNAHPQTCGARMIGAGFGGCALAVIKGEANAETAESVAVEFNRRTNKNGRVLCVSPGRGAWLED